MLTNSGMLTARLAAVALAIARRAGEPELAQRLAEYLDHYKKAKTLRIRSYDRIEGR